MGKLLLTHPKLVAEQKDLILECIDDEDISIRLRALDLVVGLVRRKRRQRKRRREKALIEAMLLFVCLE